MLNRKLYIFLILLIFFYASNATAEKAVLAGGCFWCMEADFGKLKGVTSVISGFKGGTLKNLTYKGNHQGRYEAVEITYDPDITSYKELLEYYWVNIDPFDDHGQFCDKGSSYLSAIFVGNDNEKKIAEEFKRNVEKQFPDKKIVTKILKTSTFFIKKLSVINNLGGLNTKH